MNVAKDGSHFECIGATRGKKALLEAIFFLKETLAALGELTIATQFAVINGLIHIVGFFAREMRFVERDIHTSQQNILNC